MSTSPASQPAVVAPAVSQSLPMLLLRLRENVLLPLRTIVRQHDLTEQQARVLLVLREAGPLEMMAVAESCCIAPPSLSRIIPKLRAHDLIKVERRDQDQRRVLVTLSSSGLRVAAELREALQRAHGETKRQIGVQQVQIIVSGLQEAIAALGSPGVVTFPAAMVDGHDAAGKA